jgi:hypothetical protein
VKRAVPSLVVLLAAGCSCSTVQPADAGGSDVAASPDSSAVDAGLPGIAVDIDANQNTTCALTRDGRAVCWGSIFEGVRIFDAPIDQMSVGPAVVCMRSGMDVHCATRTGSPDMLVLHAPAQPFASIATGSGNGCGITPAGALVCWPGMPAAPPLGGPVTSLRMSAWDNVCVLLADGSSTCWTMNMPSVTRSLPVPVTTVAVSVDARCGLDASGEVVCDVGQCSSSTTCDDTNQWATHVGPAPAGPWAQLELSDYFVVCARRSSGELGCWGDDYDTYVRPSEPTGTQFSDVAVGDTHVCGVTNGHVVCWGTDARSAGVLDVPAELR